MVRAKYQVKAALLHIIETEQLDPEKAWIDEVQNEQLSFRTEWSGYHYFKNRQKAFSDHAGWSKKGNVTADDIKISAETLKKQGQVAKEADNPTMDANFQRAAELVNVPDDIILDMYNKLRPNRSTKKELILMAQELLQKYLTDTI